MKYLFSDIRKIIKPLRLHLANDETMLNHLIWDTRNISSPSTALFFAFKGKSLDAHHFIAEAYDKGIRNFVVKEDIDLSVYNDANFLFVTNVVTALQELAAYHKARFSLPTIGITGSNGKTIIKEWLFQLLSVDYFIVRSPRSYNSQIGVPISVLEITAQHDLAIFEAGISRPNEMQNLANIIQCNIGIFSNIGDAHDEGFSGSAEKIKEKLHLFQDCKMLIYCIDNTLIANEISLSQKTFTWSKNSLQADFNVKIEKLANRLHTLIKGKLKNGKTIQFTIPFHDEASIENSIHCCCVMLYLNYDAATIQQRMMQLQSVTLRLELKAGINNCLIINDFYNLDLTSLVFALDFMAQQTQHGKKTLILSAIQQSGLSSQELYSKVAEFIIAKKIDKIIAIGFEIAILEKKLPESIDYEHFRTTQDFLAKVKFQNFQQETILLKGARSFEFERIAELLELKAHRTVMEINLDALRHNLAAYTRRLSPNTKMLVMVKASAYGSGSAEVAKLLAYNKVDYLGVAYTDEAVALRKEGVKLPILVLNPEEATFHALLRYDIEPEIYCLSQLKRLLPYIELSQKPLLVHLKLDTGMHRLGFDKSDIAELISILLSQNKLLVQSIFSHLAATDSAEHDDFTKQQVLTFIELYEQIAVAIGYRPLRHICNTGGIVRFPEYHFDMVRLGIGVYGVDSSNEMQVELQVVNTLKTTISQIKQIPKGESIGYSRRGVAERDLRIATIGIGYADGLLRSAGNNRYAVGIGHQLAPIIGNVCMDMCMLDITDLEGVSEGDEVVIFGEFPRVETLANVTQTIVYEVFTNISERVKRVYFKE